MVAVLRKNGIISHRFHRSSFSFKTNFLISPKPQNEYYYNKPSAVLQNGLFLSYRPKKIQLLVRQNLLKKTCFFHCITNTSVQCWVSICWTVESKYNDRDTVSSLSSSLGKLTHPKSGLNRGAHSDLASQWRPPHDNNFAAFLTRWFNSISGFFSLNKRAVTFLFLFQHPG